MYEKQLSFKYSSGKTAIFRFATGNWGLLKTPNIISKSMRGWKILNSHSSSQSKLQDFPGRTGVLIFKKNITTPSTLQGNKKTFLTKKTKKTPQHPLLTLPQPFAPFVSPPPAKPKDQPTPSNLQRNENTKKRSETSRRWPPRCRKSGNRSRRQQLGGVGVEFVSGFLGGFLGHVFCRWWFQTFFILTPIWGRFPFWLIFLRWVETTNLFFVEKLKKTNSKHLRK